MYMYELFYFAKCMCVSGLRSPLLVISNLGTESRQQKYAWFGVCWMVSQPWMCSQYLGKGFTPGHVTSGKDYQLSTLSYKTSQMYL